MAVLSGFPILSTGNLERLVDFYRAAFDAKRSYGFPGEDGTDVFVTIAIGEVVLGIGQEDVAGGVRMALWFYVDDVDESYSRALDAGAVSQSQPTDMRMGRTGGPSARP